MSIHNARPENSRRLLAVLRVLADGLEHTTREIQEQAHTVATATCVAELRAAGYGVECKRTKGRNGRPVWVYWMPVPPTPIELAALGAR